MATRVLRFGRLFLECHTAPSARLACPHSQLTFEIKATQNAGFKVPMVPPVLEVTQRLFISWWKAVILIDFIVQL